MFGIFRTTLALFVLIGHLYGPFQLGTYAVFGFYVLSGYLMTYIMVNDYGYKLKGRIKFIANRALRIFPPYYAAILISLSLLFLFEEKISEYQPLIFIPQTFSQAFQNLLLLFSIDSEPRLSPPTWALTVELFYYLAICLGISRTKRISLVWFIAGSFYTIVVLIQNPENWAARYFPLMAGSLPFSIGAMIYHFKDLIRTFLTKFRLNNPIIWLALILLNFYFSYKVGNTITPHWLFTIGFYTNLILMTSCIATLALFEWKLVGKKMDSKIGNYSYPVYLIHWQAGALLFSLTNGTLNDKIFLLLSIIITLVLSEVMIKTTANPFEILRIKIKSPKSFRSNDHS